MTSNTAYILGFAFGDGNISKRGYLVRLYEQNKEFIDNLGRMFSDCFGVMPKIYLDRYNNSYVLYKNSKNIWNALRSMGLPVGRKARIIEVPESIKSADPETKAWFVSGVFDAEASSTSFSEQGRHPRGYKYFEVKMYSPQFIEDVKRLLLDVSDEFRPLVYHYSYGSILRLNGIEQLKLVSSRLHLLHPRFSPPVHRSRNTGQGVNCHGEPKGSKPEGEAKAILRKDASPQGGGPKRPYSHGGLD